LRTLFAGDSLDATLELGRDRDDAIWLDHRRQLECVGNILGDNRHDRNVHRRRRRRGSLTVPLGKPSNRYHSRYRDGYNDRL